MEDFHSSIPRSPQSTVHLSYVGGFVCGATSVSFPHHCRQEALALITVVFNSTPPRLRQINQDAADYPYTYTAISVTFTAYCLPHLIC